MARRSRNNRSTVDNPTPGEGDHLLETSSERSPSEVAALQDEVEILNRLRQEAGNGGYVRLSRRMDGSVEYANITRIEISDYSQDRVQQVYGGGYYKLRFCTADHKICGQRSLIIDPSIPFKNPAAVTAAAAAAPVGTDLVALTKELLAKQGGGDTATMVSLFTLMMQSQQKMQESADRRFEKIMETMATTAKPATDPLAMKLLELHLGKERTPMSELLESFSAFKKITGGKSGRDEDEEELTIWEKLGKAAEPFGTALAEGLAAKFGGGETPARPARPLIVAGATAEPAAPIETNGTVITEFPGQSQPQPPAMNPIVKMKIAQLQRAAIAAAQQGANPVEFAAELLSEIPGKYYDTLEDLAKAPNWFEQMFGNDPAAIAAKEWLTKMRDAVLKELTEETPQP